MRQKRSLNKKTLLGELVTNRALYLMALPGITLFFLIHYLPMLGIIIAFKDFSISKGIYASPLARPLLSNFQYFFTSGYAWRITRNTLGLNLMFICVGTITEVFFALTMNEIRKGGFKKTIQSVIFLPYFMSWIIVSIITYSLFNFDYGAINNFIVNLGGEPVDWYLEGQYWPGIMLALHIWKWTGYHTIIYLATIAGFDPAIYEAAEIDGANKFQRIRYISIPLLLPTVLILTLLAFGRIMNADFGMFYAIVGENPFLYPYVDVIDTFVFRSLRKLGDISMASAAAFYQSIMAFMLVYAANSVVRRIKADAALF